MTTIEILDGITYTGNPVRLCKKERYLNEVQAVTHRSELLKKFGRTNGTLNAYRCDMCGCWHLGRRAS